MRGLGLAMQELVPPIPALKFFKPLPQFIDWAVGRWSRRVVYDIGAGVGHVANRLHERPGMAVIALDLFQRKNAEYPVMIQDATTYSYQPGSVAIICRPCHGDFTRDVIYQAQDQGVSEIAYIGLQRNVDADLAEWRSLFKFVLSDAGQDGECVWLWSADE